MVIPSGLGTPGSSKRSARRWLAAAGLLVLALGACRSERAALATLFSPEAAASTGGGEASVVTQVHMVRPAAERVAARDSASASTADAVAGPRAERPEPDAIDEANVYCRQVEQQARETHAGLPRRLDRDTSATRVVAYGCDVVLEYAMHDLDAEDVVAGGLRALRAEVINKLCGDAGARGVMNRGGSFTNVYRDQRSALIDQFTITAEACAEPGPADDAPVSLDL